MSKRLPKDELRAAMRAGVVDLLDELYREDGFDEPLRAAGVRALERSLFSLFETADDRAIKWSVFDGMTAAEVQAYTREGMRAEVRKAVAHLRPS